MSADEKPRRARAACGRRSSRIDVEYIKEKVARSPVREAMKAGRDYVTRGARR